jgi:hypothetical protein
MLTPDDLLCFAKFDIDIPIARVYNKNQSKSLIILNLVFNNTNKS